MTLAISTNHSMNMNGVKKEIGGFGASSPYSMPSRPAYNRPFSDGSMSIETDVLAGLLGNGGGNNHSHSFSASTTMASPFQYGSSLPPAYHYSSHQVMVPAHSFGGSPDSHSSPQMQQQQGMNPAAFFNSFKFGEDGSMDTSSQVSSSVPTQSIHLPDVNGSRSRSASATGLKSATAPSRRPSVGSRRLSNSSVSASQTRGRSMQPPSHHRTMSQTQLQSHPEDDSVSPPDGSNAYAHNSPFGLAIPLQTNVPSRGDWNGSASQTSTLLDTMGSFGGNQDMLESPATTSQNVIPLDDQGKKQRRRECHNQVEKRRREHINAKIEELSQLVPVSYGGLDDRGVDDEDDDEGNGDSPKKKKTKRANSAVKGSKDSVQCKGRILTQSVQYIRDLKRLNESQQMRIAQLEAVLMAYNPNYQAAALPNVHPKHPYFFPQGTNQPSSFPTAYPQPSQANGMHAAQESQLEMMPRSPEPEQNLSLSQDAWPSTEQQQQHPARARSVSISSDDSPDTRTGEMMGMMDFVAEETGQQDDEGDADPLPLPQSVGANGERGRPRERRDSQMDLQISMGGMGLEAMFSSVRRQEEAGGMRW